MKPKTEMTNSIGTRFRLIPAGEFVMGEKDSIWSFCLPLHRVRITRPFYLGIYQVTQKEWEAVMKGNPSEFKGDDNPVEMVSWEDCQVFIKRLNEMEQGAPHRLPTEAEWEYACRAGATTKYGFGEKESDLGDHAWYEANSEGRPHPVGKKRPNAWGLHDMHGNVFEWCYDHIISEPNYYEECHRMGMIDDPKGAGRGQYHAHRGGSYIHDADFCTSGKRGREYRHSTDNYIGLRLARSVED